MAQKELDDAKAAYQKGEYQKAASELADAAKYGAKDAYENIAGATTGGPTATTTEKKAGSSSSVPSGTSASASSTGSAPAKSNA